MVQVARLFTLAPLHSPAARLLPNFLQEDLGRQSERERERSQWERSDRGDADRARLTWLDSKNLCAQLLRHCSSPQDSFLPGVDMHLSQHMFVSCPIISFTAAFFFSCSKKDIICGDTPWLLMATSLQNAPPPRPCARDWTTYSPLSLTPPPEIEMSGGLSRVFSFFGKGGKNAHFGGTESEYKSREKRLRSIERGRESPQPRETERGNPNKECSPEFDGYRRDAFSEQPWTRTRPRRCAHPTTPPPLPLPLPLPPSCSVVKPPPSRSLTLFDALFFERWLALRAPLLR